MAESNLVPKSEERRIRQRLIEAAVRRLGQTEFSQDLLTGVIDDTGFDANRVRVYFETSEDLAFALYSRFAAELESRINELPHGTLAERFRALMEIKFRIMEPYRGALSGLRKKLVGRNGEIGVLSLKTEPIRVRVQSVLAETVAGATPQPGSISESTQSLYPVYLALMWLWLRNTPRSKKASEILLNTAFKLSSISTPYISKAVFGLPGKLAAAAQRSLVTEADPATNEKANEILHLLFRHRRLLPCESSCGEFPCERCYAFHLPKMRTFVAGDRPVHLILPAFPAKSPNRSKTIGALPDMAEEQALRYLADIFSKIKSVYPPGVRLTICSDGHVFSDLVGVADDDVTVYGETLKRMIQRLELGDIIDTFSLGDLYNDIELGQMRSHMNSHYEQSLDAIRERSARDPQAAALINGIHRFMFEDNVERFPELSRTKIRNDCRELAYQVVQRSDGWGRLLSDCFPMALRLSIHPQLAHSDKIGILLGEADDVWLTPWHAVAVKQGGKFKLMKRSQAEAMGAKLSNGSDHYEV